MAATLQLALAGTSSSSPATTQAVNEPVAWGEPKDGIQVGVTLDNTPIRRGDPVDIRVWVRNVSDKRITLPDTSPQQNHRYHATSNGEEVPQTALGKRLYVDYIRFTSRDLRPGGTEVARVRVSLFLDFSLGREFRLVVGRFLFRPEGERGLDVACSPAVVLEVVD